MIKLLYANSRHPTTAPTDPHPRAFTLLEILVVSLVLAVLAAITVAAVAHAQQSAKRAHCAANLHAIGLAFQNFAADNGDFYPQPLTGAQWEDLLRKYVPRKTFYCPADQELAAATGSSYDWRDTGDPATSLAGRRTPDVTRDNLSLAFDALPGWHEPHNIQVVLTDTSVQMIDEDAFLRELQTPVIAGP